MDVWSDSLVPPVPAARRPRHYTDRQTVRPDFFPEVFSARSIATRLLLSCEWRGQDGIYSNDAANSRLPVVSLPPWHHHHRHHLLDPPPTPFWQPFSRLTLGYPVPLGSSTPVLVVVYDSISASQKKLAVAKRRNDSHSCWWNDVRCHRNKNNRERRKEQACRSSLLSGRNVRRPHRMLPPGESRWVYVACSIIEHATYTRDSPGGSIWIEARKRPDR